MSRKQKARSMGQGAGRYRREASGGFSLAEVLIALAITSFALLALIGVLPEGLRSLQNAQRQEAEARILQNVAARHQMTPWDESSVGTQEEGDLEFDANGAPVQSGSKDTVYRARAEVLDAAPLPNENTASPFMRRVRIRVTNQLQMPGALDNPTHFREKWASIVNLDKAAPAPPADAQAEKPGTPATGTAPNP